MEHSVCLAVQRSVILSTWLVSSRYGEVHRFEPFLLTFQPLFKQISGQVGGLCISSTGPDHCSVNKPSLLSTAPQQSPALAGSFNCGGIFKSPFCNLRLIPHFTLKKFILWNHSEAKYLTKV